LKRLPFTDAFVDESVRGRRYLMACVMAEARHLPDLRPAIRALAVYERVHFNNESDTQKRHVLSAIAEMPIGVFVAVSHRAHGESEFIARNACLARIVEVVQERQVSRLVIESRDDNREDERRRATTRARSPARAVVSLRASSWQCGADAVDCRCCRMGARRGLALASLD